MHCKSYSIFFAAAVSTLPTLACAEPVTFEELENHRVTASFVYARTIRRMEENRIVKNEQRSTVTLTIRPENRIHQEAKVQVVTLNGREIGNFTGNISAELNTPRQWRNGDMVFVFERGNLIRLQTFDTGGRKITFAFKRGPSGYTCTVDAPFSKEEGTSGAISTTSRLSNQRIEILAATLKNSSCHVLKL